MPTGYKKDGTPMTPPSRKGVKLSLSHIAILKKVHTGKQVSVETKVKLSKALKGRIFSEATKQRISMARKCMDGSTLYNWKGHKVSYPGLHAWVKRKLGNPANCSKCKVVGKKNGRNWSIHWANKSHEYKRSLTDWIGLCVKCHKKYDS